MKNKKFLAGFACGLLCCLLVMGISFQVAGANRNITINDNIKVEINGTAFTPTDANGRVVPVFSYEGTTYAPIRALCEAAGMQVDYDSASRTARVTIPAGSIPTLPPAGSDSVTLEEAKQIALQHAGLEGRVVTFTYASQKGGRYALSFYYYPWKTEYSCEVDASDGEILSWEISPLPPSTEPDPITLEEAKGIALKHAGLKASEVTFLHVELDRKDWEYEVEFFKGNTEYEYKIHASSGEILSWDYDTDYHPAIPRPTATPKPTSTPKPLTNDEAAQRALDHAGLKTTQVTFFRVKLDKSDMEFEVKFYTKTEEYDYTVDAYTGEILSWDNDIEGFDVSTLYPDPTERPGGSVTLLSKGRAKEIALAHSPTKKNRVLKCELDWDNGQPVYEIELLSIKNQVSTKIECELDAVTGQVLKWEVDD